MNKISLEEIQTFIEGHDPQERIVNLLYEYDDNFMTVVYRNEKDQRCTSKEKFYPFCWATRQACERLCNGDRQKVKRLLGEYGIGVKKLNQTSIDGIYRSEFDNGYLFMFFARVPMSYSAFLNFFKEADNPVYSKDKDKSNESISKSKQYLIFTPQEQFMIATGKRFFKGYDDYDQVLKMTFDLETTGLDTKKDKINQIGIRMNRPFEGHPDGFEKIITIEGNTESELRKNELEGIRTMFKMIYTFKPDIITAHNGENFDWNVIIDACERLGTSIVDVSSPFFKGKTIRKESKESVLKLGGEMEYYRQTIVPEIIVTDSLHAVRRAQALDSSMLKADLKYVTEYSKMKKPNRVYLPGNKISETWGDTEYMYAFNNVNGDWYKYDPLLTDTDNNEDVDVTKRSFIPVHGYIKEGYELVTGKYIAERYLCDDLYECDKVEHRYNTPNFLVCKMLPVPYKKCTTMGTAVQWKALMAAWSYENDLAIPMFGESKTFTGGLSRLLRTGFVKNVIKLDFNSLYPSIILTWAISDNTDLMNVMLNFLEYVLTQREKYKKLKKVAGKKKGSIKEELEKIDSELKDKISELENELRKYAAEESFNDKKQLPLKIFGNSFFGSYGAPNVFPWGSLKCAEQTTCTGRQCLRLMISHFKKLGYEPIVGDSFTSDTPLFVKYFDDNIDIKPISELIDESKIEIDALNREYDYSHKNYKVLCRSGWVSPSYIYRHKTDKKIYEVSENDMKIDVTEDHSIFDKNKNKINPKDITDSTELEYYNEYIGHNYNTLSSEYIRQKAISLALGETDRVDKMVLNSHKENMKMFYDTFMDNYRDNIQYSKTCLAGLQYLKINII